MQTKTKLTVQKQTHDFKPGRVKQSNEQSWKLDMWKTEFKPTVSEQKLEYDILDRNRLDSISLRKI